MEGLVTNIQHFTIHDGPGIRTELFLKGCPLQCRWCSNPETMSAKPEVAVQASRCIGTAKCGSCLEACPLCDKGVFLRAGDRIVAIDREICDGCLACVDACPAEALTTLGKRMTVDQVMAEILADRVFYEKSGGGATISGGEPLVQWRFTLEVLKRCRREGIHTCLETSMQCQPEILDEVLPFTDLVITDLKQMDDALHRRYTGVGNGLIHGNIARTVEQGIPTIIRIPVVPGVNDDLENIDATARFILEVLGNRALQVQLLPYRPLGIEKYASLGREYPMSELAVADRSALADRIKALTERLRSFGIPAVSGANANTPALSAGEESSDRLA
mgnify:CR=1 FL=1